MSGVHTLIGSRTPASARSTNATSTSMSDAVSGGCLNSSASATKPNAKNGRSSSPVRSCGRRQVRKLPAASGNPRFRTNAESISWISVWFSPSKYPSFAGSAAARSRAAQHQAHDVAALAKAAGLPCGVSGLGPSHQFQHLSWFPWHRRGNAYFVADGQQCREVCLGIHAVVRPADFLQHVVRDKLASLRQQGVRRASAEPSDLSPGFRISTRAHDRHCALPPFPVPRGRAAVRAIWSERGCRVFEEGLCRYETTSTIEITLTPTLSRNTGRGGRAQRRSRILSPQLHSRLDRVSVKKRLW
jgi:hypothetical protein